MLYLFNFDIIISLDLLPTKNLCPEKKKKKKVLLSQFMHKQSNIIYDWQTIRGINCRIADLRLEEHVLIQFQSLDGFDKFAHLFDSLCLVVLWAVREKAIWLHSRVENTLEKTDERRKDAWYLVFYSLCRTSDAESQHLFSSMCPCFATFKLIMQFCLRLMWRNNMLTKSPCRMFPNTGKGNLLYTELVDYSMLPSKGRTLSCHVILNFL